MDSEQPKDHFYGAAVLSGLFCFLLIMVSNVLHHDMHPRPYHLHPQSINFLSTEVFWMLNMSLAITGTVLLDLKRWPWMIIFGILSGVGLQVAYQLYFYWRPNLLFAEVLIPALLVFLPMHHCYHLLLKFLKSKTTF